MQLEIDSAGTADYHVGEPPDRRTWPPHAAAATTSAGLRARQVQRGRFRSLRPRAGDGPRQSRRARKPAAARRAARDWRCSWSSRRKPAFDEVPDPYYGGIEDFERVLDLCEAAARGLLARPRGLTTKKKARTLRARALGSHRELRTTRRDAVTGGASRRRRRPHHERLGRRRRRQIERRLRAFVALLARRGSRGGSRGGSRSDESAMTRAAHRDARVRYARGTTAIAVAHLRVKLALLVGSFARAGEFCAFGCDSPPMLFGCPPSRLRPPPRRPRRRPRRPRPSPRGAVLGRTIARFEVGRRVVDRRPRRRPPGRLHGRGAAQRHSHWRRPAARAGVRADAHAAPDARLRAADRARAALLLTLTLRAARHAVASRGASRGGVRSAAIATMLATGAAAVLALTVTSAFLVAIAIASVSRPRSRSRAAFTTAMPGTVAIAARRAGDDCGRGHDRDCRREGHHDAARCGPGPARRPSRPERNR